MGSKQKLNLVNAKIKSDGVTINKLEVDYIYLHDDSMTVFFKQGISQEVAYDIKIKKALKDIEDTVFLAVDVP